MFYIFRSDHTYPSTQYSISPMDLMEMFHDVDILNSENQHEAVEKVKAKFKQEALLLLIAKLQTDEIKAKFESLMSTVKCLDVRCTLFHYNKSNSLEFSFSCSYM